MVEKPVYCSHCRHVLEYDTRTAKADRFQYILACPKCGKGNRRLKSEYGILLESAGVFLGIFLASYFLLHESLNPSILTALVVGILLGITRYYTRVLRPARAGNGGA
ncbi:MAG TPA: hypothetical protein VMC84_07650 [Methanocella sp.]|uniref:hypothetical protein n=1 Tax=Methanocella sp. TaxID=2052833 RepID=UPI002BBF1D47|nr:hypothetical protein [Methanocella sp.]HTY91033.1 hypothetical protein [Methanocella sp.]